jgi:hypothetical protein
MDVLDDLLACTRARGGVFNLTILDRPWGLHICDQAQLALATLVRGSGWIIRPELDPVRLQERDVAVVTGPEPYVVADDPHTAPQLRIHPGGRCEPLPGAPVDYSARLGVRTHGRRPEGEVMAVSGTYQLEGDVSRRLLDALPPVLVVPAGDVAGHVMDMVLGEIQRDEPGQQSVLDRWLDLALIVTLRAWFARPESWSPRGLPAATRWPAWRCGCCTRTRRIGGASPSSPSGPASPGRPWPAGSPPWSARPRWRI